MPVVFFPTPPSAFALPRLAIELPPIVFLLQISQRLLIFIPLNDNSAM